LLVTEKIGMPIREYFKLYGEAQFRAREREAVRDVCSVGGAVIATGGGAVLSEENVKNLKRNGKIYFLDRPLESLLPTSDRPLASSREDIEKRFRERYEIYKGVSDVRVIADADAHTVAERIMRLK
jgi:shikimate kinase